MKRLLPLTTLLTLISAQFGDAFTILDTTTGTWRSLTSLHDSDVRDQEVSLQDRKSFLGKLALYPVLAGSMSTCSIEPARASGGATAGGAYLLSAKQRYNDRVKASVEGLLKAAEELKAGESKLAKEYFSSEASGSWKDMTIAGYLLSNAFRRNSTAAPDSLPSVKVSRHADMPN